MAVEKTKPEEKDKNKNSSPEISLVVKGLMCLGYMFSSSLLTFLNKMIYTKFGLKSPLILFLVQCLWNFMVCSMLMSYKTFVDQKAFTSVEKYGIRITRIDETLGKAKVGCMLACMFLIQVLFGLYSVKLVNIPLFLTFRRCCILATIVVQFAVQGTVPNQTLMLSTTLIVLGSVVAGYESFNTDFFGYFLIWCNNFATAIQTVMTSKYNEDKRVTPFEVNFYFAALGLPLMVFITAQTGDLKILYDIFFN
mmetsp:Transcript_16049/g.27066  ORF Transcript_16049/g.27066 Transcript_16049/m.27066 type:complete len:251 (+) Transcript_16049:37-789(+)